MNEFIRRKENVFYSVATLLWAFLHIYLAHQRSFWGDDLYRYDQMQLSFAGALKSLFSESNPFAPGEFFLSFFHKAIFSKWASSELWMRLHNIYFGIGTLTLAVWTQRRMNNRLLYWMAFFSVSLTGFSTQFRPYAALFFGGAMAFYLFVKTEKLTPLESVFTWFGIIFGHLFGICFIAMACFFRRDWLKMVCALAYVAFIVGLNHYMKIPGEHGTHVPGFPQIVYEILGTLGNPKKGWVLLLLCFILGFPLIPRKLRVQTLLLLSAAILGPLLSIHFGKYFFLPRQIVGGAFAFLAVSAVGAQRCANRFKLFYVPVFLCLCVPWVFFLMGKGPFVDQPMHKYKQIAHLVKQQAYKNVLWLDPGIITSVHFYFDREFDATSKTDVNEVVQGLKINRICYPKNDLCITIPTSDDFVWNKNAAIQNADFALFLQNNKFDFIVESGHGITSAANVPVVNTW